MDGPTGAGAPDVEGLLEPSPAGEAEQTGEGLIFVTLAAFVEEYLTVLVRRPAEGSGSAWCPQWWAHPEAVARLASLWRAFEYLSMDPSLGMSTFWLHHADPHLRALMDPRRGPFAGCAAGAGHRDHEHLPTAPVPDGHLDHPAFSLHAALEAEAVEHPTPEEIRGSERPWLGWIALTHREWPSPPGRI
ncbi:DUF4913 domain-containing protein [Kitasatospora sp. NPDC048722]|uniref:DUF4913 domain-containing protein n=1 Tax=Kitasatospora sp. NPDC048722 TaxID=3155639 RepID=UPI0033CB56A9